MLETFKARLKAKFSGLNLSQIRMDALADRLHKKFPELVDEAEHDAKLDELNELQPFEELAKQDDRLRNLEAKAKEKGEKKTDPKKGDEEEKPKTDAEKLAALEAQFNQLFETVKGFQEKETKTKLNETLQAKLKEKGIPAALAKHFSVDSAEQIEDRVKEAEADFAGFEPKPGNTGKPLGGTAKPAGGKPDIKEIDAILSKI